MMDKIAVAFIAILLVISLVIIGLIQNLDGPVITNDVIKIGN